MVPQEHRLAIHQGSELPRSGKHHSSALSIDGATLRIGGDVSDGVELIGSQFTQVSARLGNAVYATRDPAGEIRAHPGAIQGLYAFQVQFGKAPVLTAGDRLNVLVALSDHALNEYIHDLEPGGILIVNVDSFGAGARGNGRTPVDHLSDSALQAYQTLAIPLTQLNRDAVSEIRLSLTEADRCRGFFMLGVLFNLFERPMDATLHWIKDTFVKNHAMIEAATLSLQSGHAFLDRDGGLSCRFRVDAGVPISKRSRLINGAESLTLGILAAGRQAGLPLVFACHPQCPSNAILTQMKDMPQPEVKAIQAEDDAAAMNIALGAAFAGAVGITVTTSPGLVLQSEGLGLGVMCELPCVTIDIQSAGPSIGMPTRSEQSDLLLALNGRNGECPLIVLACAGPSDGFEVVMEAVRLAIRYMTPVIVLSEIGLMDGQVVWQVPSLDDLPAIAPDGTDLLSESIDGFTPFERDERLARRWAAPGAAGLEHRTGALEKELLSGVVSFQPHNHDQMVRTRAAKIAKAAEEILPLAVHGAPVGDLLVLGWGSTHGAIQAAVDRCRKQGLKVSAAHLRHLHPLPANLGSVLKGFRTILVPEMNSGQLLQMLRARFPVNCVGFHKVQGRAFLLEEIERKISELCASMAENEGG